MAKWVFFALVVFLIVIAGCEIGSDGGKGKDFRTGTKGLVLSFLPDTPPDRSYGDGKFKVAISIKNDGTTPIENSKGFGGNVYLSGFDKNILRFERDPPVDGLNLIGGRTQYDPVGETEIKEFPATLSMGPNIDSYKTTLMVTSCYSYETIATPQVCIDPDPYGVTTRQKACRTSSVSLGGGQGAPVAVNRVTLNPSSEKLRFTIDIENVGGGIVYYKDSQNCDPYSSGLPSKEKDVINVEEVRIANINLLDFNACKPLTYGKISLIDGRRSIICELDLQSSGLSNSPSFVSPMIIRLKYGYSSSITKNIEIIKPPK